MGSHRGIERSHGKPRPRTPSPGSNPVDAETALTAPWREPGTGRFVKGNRAATLRTVKARPAALLTINPAMCAEWIRPVVERCQADLTRIVEAHGIAEEVDLVAIAEGFVTATAMFRAYSGLAAQGNADAAGEARAWLREARQALLTLRAEVRAGRVEADPLAKELERQQREFQTRLAARTKEGDQ